MNKFWLILLIIFLIIFNLFILYLLIPEENYNPENKIDFGVTFSKAHAQYFDLDWQQLFIDILDDLKIKKLRLSAYWDEIEPVEGQFDFVDLDWQIEQAQDREAEVILAIGRKLPRWPECREPVWTKNLNRTEITEKKLTMLEEVIEHYKSYDNITVWQVENEPFFPFGDCVAFTSQEIEEELALVRRLDSRPVMLTDSGELSSWWRVASLKPDILGISTYRVVYNKYFGYTRHILPVGYYTKKGFLVKKYVDKVIVSELQAEPWGSKKDVRSQTAAEQDLSMSLEQLRENIDFVKKMGFRDNYLWGVEWWYWRKANGDDRFWELIKNRQQAQGTRQ